MSKAIYIFLFFLISIISTQAQTTTALSDRALLRYDLVKGLDTGIRPLQQGSDDPEFVEPEKSLLKLQRQVDMQMLPSDFFPAVEKETEPFKRRALRYAVAYYRDCEVPGLIGFFDVIVPLRLDTRSGALKITYYRISTIVNPNRLQFPEDRPAVAVLPDGQASILLLFLEGTRQQLFTFEGLFTENPRPIAFLSADDVDGVKADPNVGKFAVFVRGGASRASLFVLNADVTLQNLQNFEVIKDLSATDRAVVFSILPALVPAPSANPYRATPLK